MSTFTESVHLNKLKAAAIGGFVLLIWAAITLPTLNLSRLAADHSRMTEIQTDSSKSPALYSSIPVPQAVATERVDLAAGRKIMRTSSMELVVQHPSEALDRIAKLVQELGGYVESANAGGQNSTAATLTVRVPAVRFEEARTDIRKLGVRVESESIEAKDVTKQYVDKDAAIRNLNAEEAQYLAILKQASSVKDMLAVSERLSEVRGQIERLQAEFNSLSQQIETVAISIVLRTETEAQVFGMNWRPGYQIKLALHDGLESLANYATAMMSVVFYLPAVLLWSATLLVTGIGSWRLVRCIGRRWFGWNAVNGAAETPVS